MNVDAELENNKQINCWLGCCRLGSILSVVSVPAVPISASASVIIWGWRMAAVEMPQKLQEQTTTEPRDACYIESVNNNVLYDENFK